MTSKTERGEGENRGDKRRRENSPSRYSKGSLGLLRNLKSALNVDANEKRAQSLMPGLSGVNSTPRIPGKGEIGYREQRVQAAHRMARATPSERTSNIRGGGGGDHGFGANASLGRAL